MDGTLAPGTSEPWAKHQPLLSTSLPLSVTLHSGQAYNLHLIVCHWDSERLRTFLGPHSQHRSSQDLDLTPTPGLSPYLLQKEKGRKAPGDSPQRNCCHRSCVTFLPTPQAQNLLNKQDMQATWPWVPAGRPNPEPPGLGSRGAEAVRAPGRTISLLYWLSTRMTPPGLQLGDNEQKAETRNPGQFPRAVPSPTPGAFRSQGRARIAAPVYK